MHRVRTRHVRLDLGNRALLRARELVRQRCPQPCGEFTRGVVADRLRLTFERALAHHQDRLHPQQLVERQSPPRHFLLAHRLGHVDCAERVLAVDEAVAATHLERQRIGDAACRATLQRILDPAGDLPRAERGLLTLRVDRHDLAGAIADHVDDRVGHLQPAAVHVGLAEQRDLQALAQLLLAPGLVEEHHVQSTGAVADHGLDHRAPVAGDPLGDAAYGHQHQRLDAGREVTDARLVGAIHPPARVRGEQIEHGFDTDLTQRCELLLPHSLEPFDGDAAEGAQRQRPGVVGPRAGRCAGRVAHRAGSFIAACPSS